jgi:hypothetical protein
MARDHDVRDAAATEHDRVVVAVVVERRLGQAASFAGRVMRVHRDLVADTLLS